MKNPAETLEPRPDTDDLEPAGSKDITKDKRGFMVLVRNESLPLRALHRAARLRRGGTCHDGRTLRPAIMGAEVREAARIEADARAVLRGTRGDPRRSRGAQPEAPGRWRKATTRGACGRSLLDPEEDNDWFVEMTVDLERSRDAARPVLTLERFGH